MYIIRQLLKIGLEHKLCEDALFFIENEKYIFTSIFDGCSSGIESNFASNLFSKIFRTSINNIVDTNHINLESLNDEILRDVIFKLKQIKNLLNLSDYELLSTFIFLIFDKEKSELIITISGDGSYIINDELVTIDQNNQPNYLIYNINKIYNDIKKTFTISKYEGFVKNIAIMSDGIDSFKNSTNEFDNDLPVNKLLKENKLIKSEAMLSRILNILNKEGYYNFDDLSIVRIINEE